MANENTDARGVETDQLEDKAPFEVSDGRARMKVVLDTDIGGDLDDANALALLLASPEVDLVAVTTVSCGANARCRAALARHVLTTAGRGDIPVFAGRDTHVSNHFTARLVPEHLLNAWEPSLGEVETPPAAQALVDLAAEYGPKLTIVAIGAMTNLADAIRISPATMSTVGRVVSMSGAFRTHIREANILFDPESADAVYRADLPLRVLGHEVACLASLPLREYEPAANRSPVLGELARQARSFKEIYHADAVTHWDVCAVVAVLEPSCFEFERRRVAVELQSETTIGLTLAALDSFFQDVPQGTMLEIATTVDVEAVERLFRERVMTGENQQ